MTFSATFNPVTSGICEAIEIELSVMFYDVCLIFVIKMLT